MIGGAIFTDDLKRSKFPYRKDCYALAFPGIKQIQDNPHDGALQRLGVDCLVSFNNGGLISIDEKVRGTNAKTGKCYNDIAIEEFSDEKGKKPGWLLKESKCDFVAYVIGPLGIVHILPFKPLLEAWLANGESWKQWAKPIRAWNNGYTTLSWGIDVETVFAAVPGCFSVPCTPFEPNYEKQTVPT